MSQIELVIDRLGVPQAIRPGEVNWMTAGRGITHSERFEHMREAGGLLQGVQAWVALPLDQEDCDPAFDHYPADVLPTYESGGLWARLVAGKAFGAEAPVELFAAGSAAKAAVSSAEVQRRVKSFMVCPFPVDASGCW